MTDLELIALAAERIRLREAEAKAANDRKRLAALMKLHKALDKAMAAYATETGGNVVAYSGGVKPD